jgi:hypothetical protein
MRPFRSTPSRPTPSRPARRAALLLLFVALFPVGGTVVVGVERDGSAAVEASREVAVTADGVTDATAARVVRAVRTPAALRPLLIAALFLAGATALAVRHRWGAAFAVVPVTVSPGTPRRDDPSRAPPPLVV